MQMVDSNLFSVVAHKIVVNTSPPPHTHTRKKQDSQEKTAAMNPLAKTPIEDYCTNSAIRALRERGTILPGTFTSSATSSTEVSLQNTIIIIEAALAIVSELPVESNRSSSPRLPYDLLYPEGEESRQ